MPSTIMWFRRDLRLVGADAVVVTADFGPHGRERDRIVEAALEGDGRRLVGCGTPYAVEPGTVKTRVGEPYKVYSPFYRAWRDQGWPSPIAAPELKMLDGPVGPKAGLPKGEVPADLPPPGESAAGKRLQAFLRQAGGYAGERNLPAIDGTFVPELAGIAGAAVHQPWKLPGGPPGGYPDRIVDHASERKEALARFAAIG
jgi:deoxyribodipyrimidine photolyase